MLIFILFYAVVIFEIYGKIDEFGCTATSSTNVRSKPDMKKKPIGSSTINGSCTENFNGLSVCGIGIKSKNNHSCVKWKYQSHPHDRKFENTTFCKKSKSFNWCAVEGQKGGDSWDYCRDIQCVITLSDNICNSNILWTSTSNSIELDFSKIIYKYNLLVFSHVNGGDDCRISQTNQDCDLGVTLINYYFATCDYLHYPKNDSKTLTFHNLSQNTIHDFYLFPTIDDKSIGSVAKLSLKTRMSRPNAPSHIRLANRTSTSISIEWNSPVQTALRGPATGYQIRLTDIMYKITRFIHKSTSTSFLVENLKPSMNYSFSIAAFNSAGKSPISALIWISTRSEDTDYSFMQSLKERTLKKYLLCVLVPTFLLSIGFVFVIYKMRYLKMRSNISVPVLESKSKFDSSFDKMDDMNQQDNNGKLDAVEFKKPDQTNKYKDLVSSAYYCSSSPIMKK